MIFDHSKTSILENNRIWDIWALTEKALHWGSWKYLNMQDRQIRQISLAKQIIEKVLFSNCDSPNPAFLKTTESELFEP